MFLRPWPNTKHALNQWKPIKYEIIRTPIFINYIYGNDFIVFVQCSFEYPFTTSVQFQWTCEIEWILLNIFNWLWTLSLTQGTQYIAWVSYYIYIKKNMIQFQIYIFLKFAKFNITTRFMKWQEWGEHEVMLKV